MSHQKNELNELLQYLTPQELAELEKMATPPRDASACLVIHRAGEADPEAKAVAEYIDANGYAPPFTINVRFVSPNGAEPQAR